MNKKIRKNDPKDSKYEEFLNLFRTNEERIFGYILMCVPNFARAEDILQDTMLVMWRKFDTYKKDSNFAAWGTRIAQYNIYNAHRKNHNEAVRFSSEVIDRLSLQSVTFENSNTNSYVEALLECFEKLEQISRRIISLRYRDDLKVDAIARQINQPIRSTYRALARIQQSLQVCIQSTLRKWESI